MDMETMQRLEREADERDQTAAVLEHWKRKAERRRFLAFCLNWRQVVDDPSAAVPASGERSTHPRSSLGAGTGTAGSTRRTPALGSPPRLVSGSPVPGRPTH